MTQRPISGSKGVSIYQNIGMWQSTKNFFHLIKKPLVLAINEPKRLYSGENLRFIMLFRPVWGLLNASVTHIGF